MKFKKFIRKNHVFWLSCAFIEIVIGAFTAYIPFVSHFNFYIYCLIDAFCVLSAIIYLFAFLEYSGLSDINIGKIKNKDIITPLTFNLFFGKK